MRDLRKLNYFIRRTSFLYAFFVLALILVCGITLIDLIFEELLGGRDGQYNIIFVDNPHRRSSYSSLIFGAVIFAPLIETLIFQVAVFHLLRLIKWSKKREYRIVLIGGILFGIVHFFSLFHIILATILGFFFMYVYIARYHKGGYWMVVLLHAFVNGLTILVDFFSAESVFVF